MTEPQKRKRKYPPNLKFGNPANKHSHTKLSRREIKARLAVAAAVKGGPAIGRTVRENWFFDDKDDIEYIPSYIEDNSEHVCEWDPETKLVTMKYRTVVTRTEKAIKLAASNKRAWVPLSQVEFLPGNLVKMPFWCARKFFTRGWKKYRKKIQEIKDIIDK